MREYYEGIENFPAEEISIKIDSNWYKLKDLFSNIMFDEENLEFYCQNGTGISPFENPTLRIAGWELSESYIDEIPKLQEFLLSDIDDMRQYILKNPDTPIILQEQGEGNKEPFNFALKSRMLNPNPALRYSAQCNMEGLAVKTYQSDLFNNWISTEWLDGENGVNEITRIQITDNSFTLDEFNLKSKVYNMLNRIAISGGSYEDWLDVTYTTNRQRSIENPIYLGGLIKELAFQEVVSNALSENQPLGTLAGRGTLTSKNKGGRIRVKIDEHSFIIGIASITPRIVYSQGNDWHNNLKTMDDFHKPAMDGIGFQELITDQMAWYDTDVTETNELKLKIPRKKPFIYMTPT